MKLVKFIKYYSQFKPFQMSKEDEQVILQRLSDSMNTDLDYSKIVSDDDDVSPTEI